MKTSCQTIKLGDILKGAKRGRSAAYHFIVFLDGRDLDTFIGAVLTHSSRYKNNILMKEEHFKKTTEGSEKNMFEFDSTHLIKGRFIKLQNWGPYEKTGELTNLGIKFVELQISDMEPILWEEYINRIDVNEN